MIVGSTFSGVGGMDLGLARAGFSHAFFAELDPWRRDVLAAHWPGVPCYADVKEVAVKYQPPKKMTADQIASAIVEYEAGDSCGTLGERYGVTRQAMWDLLRRRIDLRPRERMGADNHFYRNGARALDSAQNKAEKAIVRGELLRGPCEVCGAAKTDAHHDDYNEPLAIRWLCRTHHHAWHREHVAAGVVMPQEPSDVDLLVGGFPSSRAKTSASPDDEPASPEHAAAYSTSSPASPTLFDHPGSCSKTSAASYRRTTGATWASLSVRWPTSGTALRGEFSTHATSESPNDAVECSLSDVLEATTHPRYELSAKAARGILRRASARGRVLPAHLEAALESLSAP